MGYYRKHFIVLALAFLALSHFLMSKKAKPSKLDRIILWVATAAVLFILIRYSAVI